MHYNDIVWYLALTDTDFHYEVWRCYVYTRVHYNDFLSYTAHQVFLWVLFVCMIWGFQYCEEWCHGHVDLTPCGVMGRQQCCRGTHCCYLPRSYRLNLTVIGYHLWDCMSCSRWPQYELLNSVIIWHTHISGRIHTIRLIIRVEVSEWCYTCTIDCHTDRSSWFIIGIIDMKMIIMSVSVEYCCYCVFKPENKYAYYTNLLCIIYKCVHICMFFKWNFQKYRRKTSQKRYVNKQQNKVVRTGSLSIFWK